MVKHQQQLILIFVQPLECQIQRCKARLLREYIVEALLNLGLLRFVGCFFVLFEDLIEIPNLGSCIFQGYALLVVETDQLADGPLGVYPAQGV